jgi:hypothetical protein
VEFLKQNLLPTWADQFSNVALHGGSLESSPRFPSSENKSAVDSKVYLRMGGTNRRNRIAFSNEDGEYVISHAWRRNLHPGVKNRIPRRVLVKSKERVMMGIVLVAFSQRKAPLHSRTYAEGATCLESTFKSGLGILS